MLCSIAHRLSCPSLLATTAFALCMLSPAARAADPRDRPASKSPLSVIELETDAIPGASGPMAVEMAGLFDDGTTRRALPIIGLTSGQNVRDVVSLRGVDMAIVQTDVIERARADKSHPDPASGFTYIAPLWNEEFHLLARSNIQAVTDLANRRIEIGAFDSASNATASRLFGLMNLPFTAVNDSLEVALAKLAHGDVDAVAIVAAKPALVPQAISQQDGFHLLSIPPEKAITDAYKPAVLDADDYPSLISKTDPVQTVAVGTVLLAANLAPNSERYKTLEAYCAVLFNDYDALRAPGHEPKWREVDLQADVPGLTRFPAAQSWIDRNRAASRSGPKDTQSVFSQFIDARQQALGGATLSDQDKQVLFQQFQRWQAASNPSPQ